MASYSKSKSAKALGISKEEFEKRSKAAGFDTTEAYWSFLGGASAPMIQQITQQIIELDRQLDNLPGISLSDADKQNFLDKAISQVQPYYDRKTQEIQKGIQEGTLRSAEDVLTYTRDVENEVRDTLSSLDLSQAKNQEEFVNKLADITAGKDENIAAKRDAFNYQIESLKMDQVQNGIFASGIGGAKRAQAQTTENLAENQITSQAQRAQTQAETTNKYNLEQIRLAREAAQRDREAKIGAPDQTEQLKQQQLGTLGYNDINQLPGRAQIEAARATTGRNVDLYNPSALTTLEEERLKAVESRKQELQSEELDLRKQEYEKQRQKILADQAAKQSQITAYRGY